VALADKGGIDSSDVRFTRRELREALAVGDTQLRVHLARLVALEYILRHPARDGRVAYELFWKGDDVSGGVGALSGGWRPPVGGAVGPGGSGA